MLVLLRSKWERALILAPLFVRSKDAAGLRYRKRLKNE